MEVTGGWTKLHYNDLHDLHSSPRYYLGDQINKGEMGLKHMAQNSNTWFWFEYMDKRDPATGT
jgi:hypothetical protein